MGKVEKTAEVVARVLEAAEDNEHLRASGEELSRAALTISKTINNALLPLAVVNYAFDKARSYFEDAFPSDLARKLADVPAESVLEPSASLVSPALHGLAFAHEEPELKDMYLSLLASAMDARSAESTHPAFASIIRQLTAREAHVLQRVLPIMSWAITKERVAVRRGGKFIVVTKLQMEPTGKKSTEPERGTELPAMVDNWIRLALVSVTFINDIGDDTLNDWDGVSPSGVGSALADDGVESVMLSRNLGKLRRTEFGHAFARAVGILPKLL